MQEYYIRKEGDEDSRGPFTLEQLSSLVEAGQVDRQTYYYDAISEKWMEVQANPELVAALFPVKRKLTIRAKDHVPTVNVTPAEDERPITVEEMLAAAEGQTEETRGRRDLTADEARAALWGMRIMSVIMLISAAGMLVPQMAVLSAAEFWPIVTNPLIVLGAIDVLFALFLFLEVTTVYPALRIRLTIGVGYFLVYFLAGSEWLALAGLVVASAAVFILTMLVQLWKVILAGLVGLAASGGFAYLMLS